MQINTFSELVSRWVETAFRGAPRFVRRRRTDGEFEAYVSAPKGAQAGRLTILTWRGDLWVRFDPPHMFYSVDSRAELRRVVRALLSEAALFATTYRQSNWHGVTLIPKGKPLKPKRGETITVVSWSGQHDRTISHEPTKTPKRARRTAA